MSPWLVETWVSQKLSVSVHFMCSILERKQNRNSSFKRTVMKKIFLFISIIITGAFIFISSCSKNIEGRTDNAAPLSPTNIDLNAGTWKPILLSSAAEFAVPAPIAINTPDYIAQVNEIKSFKANLTQQEKDIVKYWSAGAVFRWNEILRELVAKHNLPPYQNPDGTYPLPNACLLYTSPSPRD